MKTYNIFSETRKELKDFFEKKIKIASAVVGGKEIGGYEYSQWETIQNIEFVDNSKFLKGDLDSEGQQKYYINMASFRKEVASKNIDLDLKNFLFIPEEDQSEYGTIIVRKKFRKWAKDNLLSEKLNDSVDRFPKMGTVVCKRVGKEIEIVPLIKLRNEQGADSLKKAKYVIQEHTDMTLSDMEDMPDWDTSELEMKWDDKISVYERYAKVPLSTLKEYKGESSTEADEKKSVYCVAIIALDKVKGSKEAGSILFMEETECPFVEVHYAKQDGRWLGIGEIEKQFENQAARNMVFNMRKKALAWSVKNIFQTMDDTQVNNMVREVKDGDVLLTNTPGGFQRLDTGSRAGADFNGVDQSIEQNADQRSFTFEVSTGESLPSGTPFRLGAIIGQSANAYYGLKREKLGIFWKNVIYNFMLPTFYEESGKEFIEGVCDTDEGFETLRQAKREMIKTDIMINAIIKGVPIVPEAIDLIVDLELQKKSTDYYKMTKDEVKALKYRFDIDVTGESVDVPKKIETLTNLYTALIQTGDIDTAREVLKKILVLTGEKMPRQIPQMGQPALAGQQAGQIGGQLPQMQQDEGQVAPNLIGNE
jgi:hypothetical protein